jgi:hypothetical protein
MRSTRFYVKALLVPFTVNTRPEVAWMALADHDEIGAIHPAGGGDRSSLRAARSQAAAQ